MKGEQAAAATVGEIATGGSFPAAELQEVGQGAKVGGAVTTKGSARVTFKVGNMSEFFEKTTFGKAIEPYLEWTKKTYQNQKIFRVTENISADLKKGYYVYLDNLHKDHLEVFDKQGIFRTVINLDGSVNLKKLEATIDAGRSISKLL